MNGIDIFPWLTTHNEPEPDCDTCDNTGEVEAGIASWAMKLKCPDCPRGDWLEMDAEEEASHR